MGAVRVLSPRQLELVPPLPPAASQLLGQAHRGLAEAATCSDAGWRYATAHLAALRAAAAVLAARTRPESGRRRPRSAWVLIGQVAPELGEWASFFAAGAAKRAAAEAGLSHAVTEREADDLVRDVSAFLAVVETTVARPVSDTAAHPAPPAGAPGTAAGDTAAGDTAVVGTTARGTTALGTTARGAAARGAATQGAAARAVGPDTGAVVTRLRTT